MSQYLLNIAARNIAGNTNEMQPSIPVFNISNSETIEDFEGGSNIQDSPLQNDAASLAFEKNRPNIDGQNKFGQQIIVPNKPAPAEKAKQAFVSDITETKVQKENSAPSYFSKHIERRETEQDNTSVINKAQQTKSIKIEAPSQKNTVKNIEANAGEFEKNIFSKLVSNPSEKEEIKKQIVGKIALKPPKSNSNKQLEDDETIFNEEIIYLKKQLIKGLSNEEQFQSNKKILPKHIHVERLNPNRPDQVMQQQVQTNKMNEAAPKLIIGKITVEMMPPKLPAQQKIITKVVQPPSKDSYSKSNKLIFGLGQL